MGRKDPVHVGPHPKGWAVSRAGAKRPTSLHTTQKEALGAGKAVAMRDRTEFVLYGRDGQVRQKSSYNGARPKV